MIMKMRRYSTDGLSEHDKALVDMAYSPACYRDAGQVHRLMGKAETDRGRNILHLIASDYYHADEYECGIL